MTSARLRVVSFILLALLVVNLVLYAPTLFAANCQNMASIWLLRAVLQADGFQQLEQRQNDGGPMDTATLESARQSIHACENPIFACDRVRMLGVLAVARGDVNSAKDLFDAVCASEENHPMVRGYQALTWELSGRRALSQGDLSTALAEFALAETAWPRRVGALHRDVYQDLCVGFYRDARFSEARAVCQRSMALKPDKYAALFSSVAEFKLGNLSAAEENLRIAQDLDENWYEPYFWLGELYLSRNQYGRAEREYNLALDRNPQDYDSRWRLVDLYLKQGKVESAVEQLTDLTNTDNPAIAQEASRLLEELQNAGP